MFQAIDFLQLRHAHGAARAFQQLVCRHLTLLPQARELAESQFEDAGHASGAALGLHRTVQLRQITAGPETGLKLIRLATCATDHRALIEDDRPRHQ